MRKISDSVVVITEGSDSSNPGSIPGQRTKRKEKGRNAKAKLAKAKLAKAKLLLPRKERKESKTLILAYERGNFVPKTSYFGWCPSW